MEEEEGGGSMRVAQERRTAIEEQERGSGSGVRKGGQDRGAGEVSRRGGGGDLKLWRGCLFDSHCHLNLVLR